MSNPKKIEYLDPAENLQDDDLLFASVREGGAIYVSKKVTLKDIADYVRSGMTVVPGSENGSENDVVPEPVIDDTDPEPIVVEDEPEQPDEPVSTTKASIAGAATCTTNASSSNTSLTLGITQKIPDDASLQYAISASKTSTPTSWTNASVTNNKLTLSISFTAETTQTKYLFIKVSGDGYEDSTYYVGIRQAYNTNTTYSTTYSTKTQQIIATSIGAATNQRNTLVAAHPEWVNPSTVWGSHNIWYFTYQVPNRTSTTTSTYGHSISEQLTFVS